MKRRHFLLGLVSLLLSVFCWARPAAADASVPFKGRVYISPIDISTLPHLNIFGQGVATQLGRVHYEQHHTVIASGPPAPGLTFLTVDGTFVLTAANGDTLFGTHTGTVTWLATGQALIYGIQVVKGGTGRFAGAGGVFLMEGIQEVDGSAFVGFDGTLFLTHP